MTTIHELHQLGQSAWVDYIRRQFIEDGGLQKLLDQGVRGVTSNPSIFEKAISGSSDYDAAMQKLVDAGQRAAEIYEALALDDIQRAADMLRPIYDESGGADGFVSLEVSPTLAHDTDGTVEEARRLHAALGRPNVMIKVPATPQGIPAIRTLIGAGVSVNVTLIFSLSQYEAVMEAYLTGLEAHAGTGGDLSRVASVASFFVSRVDSAVDQALEAAGNSDLQGKIAIANAQLAYARFQEVFSGPRWDALAARNAQLQRPLWASTGTKNPQYPDTLYVDRLIGPHTVNTMPTGTLEAFLDHGTPALTLENDVEQARADIAGLRDLSIDLDLITETLQAEGVAKFAQAFESMMQGIEEKREKMRHGWYHLEASLGAYQSAVDAARDDLRDKGIMGRLWAHDHTVWKPEPAEITNRLGWLRSMDVMHENLDRLQHLVKALQDEGYTDAVLLGMGGSSLAPEVFMRTFGVADGHLRLSVLDSTDPGAVLAMLNGLNLSQTAFIVSTKSGGTAETLSFFKFFYNRVAATIGQAKDAVGQHFIAITDPGSKLEDIAGRYKFRALFLNDPNIGGRYSALSYFGIVPAALIGVDVPQLLERASQMAVNCDAYNCPSEGDNNGARLGAILGELAQAGRDKVTFITSPAFESFGDWVEQLIAESTGKEGKGILPVVGEALGAPETYGADRLFVYLRLASEDEHDAAVDALDAAGHPVVWLHLRDRYDLGGQMFLWEMATAIAGQRLGINPFDQPNVEAAKVLARQMIAEYEETGKLPELEATLSGDGMSVYGAVNAANPAAALRAFLDQAGDGAYIALQAYVQPTEASDEALDALRTRLRDVTRRATTLGYGPRFLHSTGQLHKGDAGQGLFIQFTATMPQDAPIPDEAGEEAATMSFGTLKMAQALGDRQALLDAGRKVIRFDLGDDIPAALRTLTSSAPELFC